MRFKLFASLSHRQNRTRMVVSLLGICLLFTAGSCSGSDSASPPIQPSGGPSDQSVTQEGNRQKRPITFRNASVHDPSIIRTDDGTYYVFGSHLQAAKSDDLINWKLLNSGVYDGNSLIPNVKQEMAEAFEWGQTDTFWAGDIIQLPDGKFYMYYSVCKGDSPRAAIGIAVSDHIEGPFVNQGLIIKSGMWGQPSEDGTIYDATRHPNAIDPHVFFDKEGVLWMVYGSYSGGIFILKMDPETGQPLPDQGYGKKLLGGNHSRIEGPYILYSPDTNYYYLFLSFGGLTADGGYNLRVARSRAPDGPYLDAENHDMLLAHGADGSFFDDRAIEPYGVMLLGNFQFGNKAADADKLVEAGPGYVSPGHNSAYYDAATGRYFLIIHTRFPSRGERHEIRVHQMWMNAAGWPVVGPHRYTGETIGAYAKEEIAGEYEWIDHRKMISAEANPSVHVTLAADGSIGGDKSGSWSLNGDNHAEILIDGTTYRGVFVRQWHPGTTFDTIVFTASSANGEAVWGSKL